MKPELADTTKTGATRCSPLVSGNTSIRQPKDWRRSQRSGTSERSDAHVVDLDAARAFLSRLGSDFTFQTFAETGPKRSSLTHVRHGGLAEHAKTLVRLNQQGAGVFFMVNAGDGKGRKTCNIQTVRALVADLDGAPLAPVRAAGLVPHIIVETSRGRWHAYWLVEGVPLEQFKPLQQAIAAQFGSDRKVCDLPRVMRLPGFLHNKGEPFLSRVIVSNDMPRYTLTEVVEAFGRVALSQAPRLVKAPARQLANAIREGERNNTLFELGCGLVRSGIKMAGVNQRLQTLNAMRCQPPLCATEVDAIAAHATGYGSKGFDRLPHMLTDSLAWVSLPPAACVIVLAFYRRFNGYNNGRLCVPWSNFNGAHGMTNSGSFYRHLRRIVNAGILILTAESRRTQTGTIPAQYAIADVYLPVSRSALSAPSGECSNSTIKQITALECFSGSAASGTLGDQT
jgi:hypothetical protein